MLLLIWHYVFFFWEIMALRFQLAWLQVVLSAHHKHDSLRSSLAIRTLDSSASRTPQQQCSLQKHVWTAQSGVGASSAHYKHDSLRSSLAIITLASSASRTTQQQCSLQKHVWTAQSVNSKDSNYSIYFSMPLISIALHWFLDLLL